MTKEGLSLSTIRDTLNQSFMSESSRRKDVIVSRTIDDYERILPRFNGETFIDTIESRIADGESVRILDIGCGKATMLSQLKSRYGKSIVVTGVTAQDFRPEGIPSQLSSDEYIVYDAHRLRDLFEENSFDVSVSTFALLYMADPLRVVKNAYALLSEGGRGYFDAIPLVHTSPESVDHLTNYWRELGIRSEFQQNTPFDPHSLAIEKGSSRNIPMPFSYKGEIFGHFYYQLNQGNKKPVEESLGA